mmetsp:Transcript_49773/g.159002  ORF Transcript_49773/g.159002 Transcript_49773/m.159002 type:complete len:152 (-) Transcript_49773:569-1024(-)
MGLAGREMLLMVVGVMCLGSVVNGNTASSAGIQTPISGYGIVGEAITVELEDSRLQEVVAFSLAELNKRATSKGPRSLMEVVSAHKQIVKGTLYHIALRVSPHTARLVSSTDPWDPALVAPAALAPLPEGASSFRHFASRARYWHCASPRR